MYVVASQKSHRLHIFEVPSGKLILSRKFGPATSHAQFNIAVDEKSMIGITAVHGMDAAGIFQRYKVSQNLWVCNGTGTIYAFDLNNGRILWQIINPFGTINESSCYNDTLWEDYVDHTVETNTTCEYNEYYGEEWDGDWKDNINIHIPPKGDVVYEPLFSAERAKFYAPVTIVNDMVIVPSYTGDIWIHDLYDGSFIHHFSCPNEMVNGLYNRPGIKSGI
eukprot:UN03667